MSLRPRIIHSISESWPPLQDTLDTLYKTNTTTTTTTATTTTPATPTTTPSTSDRHSSSSETAHVPSPIDTSTSPAPATAPVTLSANNCISLIYSLCTALPNPLTHILHSHIHSYIHSHIKSHILPKLLLASTPSSSAVDLEALHLSSSNSYSIHQLNLLSSYSLLWSQFSTATHYLSLLTTHLDRLNSISKTKNNHYTTPSTTTAARKSQLLRHSFYASLPIQHLAYALWNDVLLENDPNGPPDTSGISSSSRQSTATSQQRHSLSVLLIRELVSVVDGHRDGDIDTTTAQAKVRGVARALVELGKFNTSKGSSSPLYFYCKHLETPLLIHTRSYYRQESASILLLSPSSSSASSSSSTYTGGEGHTIMSLIKNKTTSFTSPSKIAFKLASSIVSTSSLHPSSPSRIRSSTYGNDSSSNNGSNSGGVNADHDDELKLVSVFLETAEKRVAEEYDRAVRFFDISSVEKIMKEIDEQYITAHKARICCAFDAFLDAKEYADCSRAYRLLLRIPDGLIDLLTLFQQHVVRVGVSRIKSLVTSSSTSFIKDPRGYIDTLAQLHAEYTGVCAKAFDGNVAFVTSIDKASREVVNMAHKKLTTGSVDVNAAELLARYCDGVLKRSNTAPPPSSSNTATITASAGLRGSSSSSSSIGKNLAVVDGLSSSNNLLNDSSDTESMTEDVDSKLHKAITLFKYLDDKDIFQKFHSKFLAKRLLLQHSSTFSSSSSSSAAAIRDSELSLIAALRETCGAEYTSRMQRLISDVELSGELVAGFRQLGRARELLQSSVRKSEGGGGGGGLELSVLVFSSGSWPFTAAPAVLKSGADATTAVASTSVILPVELEKTMQLFAAYYTSKHSGRKLNWLHQHHGRVEVKLLYTDKKYDLSLMLVQFLVLSTFEKTAVGEVVGVDDIVNFTGLVNVEEVGRVVKSLVDVNLLKKKIELSGDGGGGVLKENDMIDRFVLNHGFTSKRIKIKIPPPSSSSITTTSITDKSSTNTSFLLSESAATHKSIADDRRFFLQATIVRIMKSRRSASHNDLIQETVKMCVGRFRPEIPAIKQAIEQLIDKQYIERAGESGGYVYIS